MKKISVLIVIMFTLAVGIYANGEKVREDNFIIETEETTQGSSNNSGINIEVVDFKLDTLDDGIVELEKLKGKPTIVNFFASWCPPCRQEIPDFNNIYQKYGEKVNIVGINIQEDKETVKKMVEELNMKYTIGLDIEGEIAYNYGVTAIPTTVFYNSKGQIEQIYPGMMNESKLEEIIKDLK